MTKHPWEVDLPALAAAAAIDAVRRPMGWDIEKIEQVEVGVSSAFHRFQMFDSGPGREKTISEAKKRKLDARVLLAATDILSREMKTLNIAKERYLSKVGVEDKDRISSFLEDHSQKTLVACNFLLELVGHELKKSQVLEGAHKESAPTTRDRPAVDSLIKDLFLEFCDASGLDPKVTAVSDRYAPTSTSPGRYVVDFIQAGVSTYVAKNPTKSKMPNTGIKNIYKVIKAFRDTLTPNSPQ